MTRETVTPEQAEAWLGRNKRNRHIRQSLVQQYARDMKDGNWPYTGDAIRFDTDGNLLDGQHRLKAIVEAGVPLDIEVIRGLAPETQNVMDTGAKRTYGDMLALHGYTAPGVLAAAARIALRVENGLILGNRFKPTQGEILRFIEANPDLTESTTIGVKYGRRADARPSVWAYCHFILAQIDREKADAFMIGAATKVGLEEGDPRLVLALRLADLRRAGVRVSDADSLSLIYRAWNAWREDRKMVFIRNQTDGGGHVAIPRPH